MTLVLVVLLAAGPPDTYDAEIRDALADTEAVWKMPSTLVLAVIRQESNFNPKAVSVVGAKGLMQLMPETAAKVGVAEKELFTPARNILAGVRLLATLLKYYSGDVVSALVAYNSGPKRGRLVPDNGETPGYVLGILSFWREYEASLHPEKRPAPTRVRQPTRRQR